MGALLALMLFKTEFSLIALIGVILLIGIVKKNAIMMIDFALARAARWLRRGGPGHLPRLQPAPAPHPHDHHGRHRWRAACWRWARAMAPSCASRWVLPWSGGLLVSQLLTLYTTPVVYVVLDRLRQRVLRPVRRREIPHAVVKTPVLIAASA